MGFCNNFLELIDETSGAAGERESDAVPCSREYTVCADAVGVAMAAVRRLSANVYDC